jgi:hypothetical protein
MRIVFMIAFHMMKKGNVQKKEKNNSPRRVVRDACIAVALVACIVGGAVFFSSEIPLKMNTALSAGGHKISEYEYRYWKNEAEIEYDRSVGTALGAGTESLSEETRDEIIDGLTDARIQYVYRLANAANDAGFEMTSAMRNAAGTYEAQGVPKSAAEAIVIGEAYKAQMRESFEFTQEETDDYYDENKDMLDTFDYRYVHIAGGTTAAAVAESIAAADTEEKFEQLAAEYSSDYKDPDSTLHSYSGDLLGGDYGPWLRESGRKPGDTGVFEMATGYYAVYFIKRSGAEETIIAERLRDAALSEWEESLVCEIQHF